MAGPIRPQFVLFGSSIVQFSYSHQGWGAVLADLYARKADILLRGYAGWNSRCALQVLDEVFPKDAAVQPSLVIVYFGGNDSLEPHPSGLTAHVPLPEYVENMRKIAIHLKSLSQKTRIIFLTAPAVNEAQITEVFGNSLGRSNESCRKYSEACVQLCQELDVKVIDLWKALQQRDDWLTACFTDGIHLSCEGSKIVVKLSRTKTEYMKCKFSVAREEIDTDVKLVTQPIPKRENFKYLGSIIQSSGDIDDDVTHRIGAAWTKWRLASGVLCDKKILPKLKDKFYRMVVRPSLLYGVECWPIKNAHVQKMHVSKMRMLRWMCGHTRRDKIKNEIIQEKLEVAPVADKMREARL